MFEDIHNHQCPRCGTAWTHDRAAIPTDRYDEAHTCPVEGCGGRDTLKRDIGGLHSCDRAPAYCHNGARTLAIAPGEAPLTREQRVETVFQFAGFAVAGVFDNGFQAKRMRVGA